MFAGAVLTPLLLPWLPTRVFAVKGAVAGALCTAAALLALPGGVIEVAGMALLGTAIASYMAMMFTGATTFTNLAGARLEVRRALPLIKVTAALGLALRVAAAFV
jgi:acetyl-CoA decarbonylase/synthase complex subunit gamma